MKNTLISNVASLVLAALFSFICVSAQGLQTRLISGRVHDGNKGIANVAVTDGMNIVRTDIDGKYSLLTLSDTRFVYITTPSGYETEVKDSTIPQFYKELTAEDTYDFCLKKSDVDVTNHVFFVHADAQVTSVEDVEQYKSIVADNVALKNTYSGMKVFGMDCGDIVGDSPWFFPNYVEAVKPLDMPIFRAIGNHDMDYFGRTYETSYKTFETYFGPKHFSFDCGDAHYIVIDDNFYTGYGINYFTYVDEKTFRWLEQDLAGVAKDKLLFVFMHIPTSLVADLDEAKFGTDEMTNVRQFHALFEGYETHIVSGHTHFNLNVEYSDKMIEHNTAAACGTWWRTEECMDGTPRGYAVFEVTGKTVKWYYKSSGYDRDYQMRVYAPGSAEEFPEDVIANVWNYDSRWKVELLENGVKTADMVKYTDYDPISREHCSNREIVLYDWIWPIKNSHMFHAKPLNPNAKIQVRATDRFGNVYIQDL